MLDQPFDIRLRNLIETPPLGSIPMDITPEMAEAMLTYNSQNRPMSEATVLRYAQAMADGKWKRTHDPIKFADNGMINDGQHRLKAISLAGVTIRMHVTFGEPRECFTVTDIGKARTTSDIFAIDGVPNHSLMSATCRLLHQYGAGRQPHRSSGTQHSKPTHDELRMVYLENPNLQQSSWVGHLAAKSKLAAPSVAVFCHYLAAQKARTKADEFFRQVLEGVGIENNKSPAYKLRAKLIDNATSPRKLQGAYIAAYMVLGWNAFHTGRPLALRWRDGSATEAFPRVA